MKTLKLNIVHRLLLNSYLDEKGKEGGTLSEQNKMMKVMDRLVLAEVETQRISLRMEDSSLRWNTKGEDGTDLDPLVDIELTDEQADLLKTLLKEKNEKKQIKMAEAAPLTELAKQLEIEL